MSTEFSSSKSRFWMLPADNFMKRLLDPAQRQQLHRNCIRGLWMSYGLLFLDVAAFIFLAIQNRSETDYFWVITIFLICFWSLFDLRYRRYFIELVESLGKRESAT